MIRLIRKLALLLIAAVVILAGALAANALMTKSRQIHVAALSPVAVDTDAVAKRLAEAIRFRTISSFLDPEQSADAFRGLHAFMQANYPAFHAATKR